MDSLIKDNKTNEKDLNSTDTGRIRKRCVDLNKMGSCDFCNGSLAETKDLVMSKGKSVAINVKECTKCGEAFSSLKETERVRKELHPSLWSRIKNCFNSQTTEIEIF